MSLESQRIMLIKHIKSKESMRILIQSGPSCVCLDPAFKSLWPQMFTQVVSVMRSSTTDWILIVREPQETAYKPSEGKLNKEQIQANSMQLWRKWTTAAKLRYLCCFPLAGKKKKKDRGSWPQMLMSLITPCYFYSTLWIAFIVLQTLVFLKQ